MICTQCRRNIEYVSTRDGVIPVDVEPVTVYTQYGHMVTGRVKHECERREKEQISVKSHS